MLLLMNSCQLKIYECYSFGGWVIESFYWWIVLSSECPGRHREDWKALIGQLERKKPFLQPDQWKQIVIVIMECRKPSVKLDQILHWKTWQRLRGSAPNFLDFPFANMPIAQVIPSDSDSASGQVRKIQFAPTRPGRQPSTTVRKDFMFSPGGKSLTVTGQTTKHWWRSCSELKFGELAGWTPLRFQFLCRRVGAWGDSWPPALPPWRWRQVRHQPCVFVCRLKLSAQSRFSWSP